ncbi:transposase [Tahibacter aquaticus]|uniref:Transposase n=1 Tax=Tahibacter aquaticus TaxID=520092 RepID=A0A4R6YMH9_9GAMM|nr:IS21 family transposase [Tahibacter aquaticus]TDR38676.1 transposase [Tahibacter aquaticus]
MYEYRQVLVRLRQGDSDRDVARSRLMGRRKVAEVRQQATSQGWLDAQQPLPDDAALAAVFSDAPRTPTAVSTLEPWREQIVTWVDAGVQGTTIHATLRRNHGYTGSYSAVRRFVQHMAAQRPLVTTMRLTFLPAEAAQVDFGAGPTIVDVHTGEVMKTWIFVMTLAFSRHQYAEVVRDQTVATWLACHRRAFEHFGGVPERIIIDNPKCAITRASVTDPVVQRAYAQCAEGYGFRISACPPADPQKKGIVESGVKYIKRSFVPLRTFRDVPDANRQLLEWVFSDAGTRCHGTTREQPLRVFAQTEQALLKPLPDVPPELAVWAQVSVHRDAHVQFEKVLYSVPFRLMGQRLWLKATASLVTCYREHELVATHPRHSRPGARSTVRDHLPPEALAWSLADPQYCLQEAQRIGPSCLKLITRLFADRVMDNLRAAQGVIRLAKAHGPARLEVACQRAMSFDSPRYRTVKTILANGLDQAAQADAFDAMAETYVHGGRFCRQNDTGRRH